MDTITQAVCSENCPVRKAASVLDGKWTTQIIRDLLGGRRRFSELLRSLDGISPRILSSRLKMLEELGLLTRTIYPVVPPHTEYELTGLGHELRTVISAMAGFGAQLASAIPDQAA